MTLQNQTHEVYMLAKVNENYKENIRIEKQIH